MKITQLFKVLMVGLPLCCSEVAFGENKIVLEPLVGVSITDESNYDDSAVLDFSAGLKSPQVTGRVGLIFMPEFVHKSENTESDIRIDGAYFSAAYTLKTSWSELEFGGGLVATSTEAVFANRKVADESGVSPMLDFRMTIPLTKFFGLQGSVKHINDVAGSDLNLIQFGTQFRF